MQFHLILIQCIHLAHARRNCNAGASFEGLPPPRKKEKKKKRKTKKKKEIKKRKKESKKEENYE